MDELLSLANGFRPISWRSIAPAKIDLALRQCKRLVASLMPLITISARQSAAFFGVNSSSLQVLSTLPPVVRREKFIDAPRGCVRGLLIEGSASRLPSRSELVRRGA